MNEDLKDDYNLDVLTLVRPVGDEFDMYVTPRFVDAYAHGYETLSTRITRQQVARQELFIDVGAHYGYYSLLAVKANPKLNLVAIEPIVENLNVLQKNLKFNGIEGERITCINAAVSSKAGHIQFCKSEASDNGSIYPHPSSETLDHIDIATVCLDDVVAAHPVERIFVKTDTDGHELEVLKGFSTTLDSGKDVTILLEMNPKMMKIANTSAKELIDFLHGKGFSLFAIDDEEGIFYPMEQPANIAMMEARYETSYYNVLCIRKEAALSVLFFSHSSALSGAERSLLDLVSGISRRGAMCTAVLPSRGPLSQELINAGCAVFTPSSKINLTDGWWWAALAPTPLKSELSATRHIVESIILPQIASLAPDVIFSQTIVSPWGILCAEALNRPHALAVREYGELDHQLTFFPDFRKILDALYQSSDAVFCITHNVKEALFPTDPENKIAVIYSHIQLPEIQIKRAQHELVSPPNTIPIFGVFGNITPEKGQLDLVRACLNLLEKGVECHCWLVGASGDTVYAEKLQEEIQKSGFEDRFRWTGYVNDPYSLMQEVDVVISCSRMEALGRTLIEASLLGKPIIYANAGGPKEVFTNFEHGLAYTPGDATDLANALKTTRDDPAATHIRAENAGLYVRERFSEAAYTGTVFEQLKKIKNKNSRPMSHRKAVAQLMAGADLSSPSLQWVKSKLYFSHQQAAFTEKKALISADMPLGSFSVVFTLPDSDCSFLRFDPVDAQLITLKIYAVSVEDTNGTVSDLNPLEFTTNGILKEKGTWVFLGLDPYVVIHFPHPIRQITISGETRLILPEELQQLTAEQETHYTQKIVECNCLKIQHAQTTAENNSLKIQHAQTTAENNSLKAKQAQTTAEVDCLKIQHAQTTAENESLKIQHAQTTAENESLKIQYPQKTAENESLKIQISALRRSLSWRITWPLRAFLQLGFNIVSIAGTCRRAFRQYGIWNSAIRACKAFRKEGFQSVAYQIKMPPPNHAAAGLGLSSGTSSPHGKTVGTPLGMQEFPTNLNPYTSHTNEERCRQIQETETVKLENAQKEGLSVIILNLDRPEFIIPLCNQLLAEKEMFTAQNLEFEILIGDTGTTNREVRAYYEKNQNNIRLFSGLKYHFSKNNNQLAREAQCKTFLFLNNDIELPAHDNVKNVERPLLTMYRELNSRPQLGIVGAYLYFKDMSIQHAGIDFIRDPALRGFCYHPRIRQHINPGNWPRFINTPCVTGACLMIKAPLFEQCAGLSEAYDAECQDVDLCLRVQRAGRTVGIVNAGAVIHLENGTRKKMDENWQDRQRFMRRWGSFIEAKFL